MEIGDEVIERKRPFGVWLVILSLAANLAINILDAALLAGGTDVLNLAPDEVARSWRFVFDLAAAVVVAVALLGLFLRAHWAWALTMILTGLSLFAGVWSYLSGGEPYINLLLGVLTVFYLNLRSVQNYFKEVDAGLAEQVQ